MDSTYLIGFFLVGLSAVLLASHWQQWRDSQTVTTCNDRWFAHTSRTLRRRTFASSLMGGIGVTLMAFDTVPKTPWSITAYLFSLVFMTSWVLWLALLDLLASRRFHHDRQLDEIASELIQAKLDCPSHDSSESR